MKNPKGIKTISNIKTKVLLFNFLLLVLVPVSLFAADININIPNPAGKNNNLLDIMQALLQNIVLPVGAVLVVMYIIYSGFTFVTAQGNPKKIEEAQKRLLWSLVGGAILLGSVAISAAVQATLKNIIT